MHRVHFATQCSAYQESGIQIAFGGAGAPDANRTIRKLDCERVGVRFGIDLHSLYPQLVARTDHAHGNLAAICYQNTPNRLLNLSCGVSGQYSPCSHQ